MTVAKKSVAQPEAIALPGKARLSFDAIALDEPTKVIVACTITNQPNVVFSDGSGAQLSGPHWVGTRQTTVALDASLRDLRPPVAPRPPSVRIHGDVKEDDVSQFQVDWAVRVTNPTQTVPTLRKRTGPLRQLGPKRKKGRKGQKGRKTS